MLNGVSIISSREFPKLGATLTTLPVILIGVLFAIVVVVVGAAQLRIAAARRSGVLPAEGQSTMADVERLALMGETVWAIRCYREIHPCGLAEAKRVIESRYPVAKPRRK